MPNLDLSPEQLQLIAVNMIVLILSIAVHEFGHAMVADLLGDRLPRSEGRVTLNPIAHIDPIGTLALPLLGSIMAGGAFGWGRPVRVNPIAFTRRFRMRTGHMLVAAAGPAMNLLFATLISLLLFTLMRTGVVRLGDHRQLVLGMINAITLNYALCLFNLVPASPLDGGAVLEGLLPDRARPAYASYKQYSLFVAMAVMMIPTLGRTLIWGPAVRIYNLWGADVLGLPRLWVP